MSPDGKPPEGWKAIRYKKRHNFDALGPFSVKKKAKGSGGFAVVNTNILIILKKHSFNYIWHLFCYKYTTVLMSSRMFVHLFCPGSFLK